MKQSNPQGKGVVPVLQALEPLSSLPVPTRTNQEWLQDYLVGALIVSAKFSFKPVINQTYYLYWYQHQWQLSMISPQEWGVNLKATPVAACLLKADYSWKLTALDSSYQTSELKVVLEKFQTDFIDFINTDTPLVNTLPFYSENLPWYPRLMALGLAKNLQSSLSQIDLKGRSGKHLLTDISISKNLLLELSS